MVGEYNRQVRPQAGQVFVPGDQRSGVAEGLGALGEGMSRAAAINADTDEAVRASQHRIAMEERRRADAHAATVWSGQNADAETALQSRIQQLRDASKPGAVDHLQDVEGALQEWGSAQLAAIPADADPELRDRLGLIVQKSTARYRANEFGWSTEQRHKYEGAQAERFGASLGRDAYAGVSGPGFDVAMTKIDVFAANLDMDGTARDAISHKLKRDYVLAGLDGLVDRGEDARVAALVADGTFGQYLDDNDISRYTRAAAAIGKSRTAEAEAAQADAQRLVRDQVSALRLRVDAGDVPSAAELRTVADNAQRMGLPADDQTRIGVMAVQADAARTYQTMDPAGRRRSLDGLTAAIAAGTATADQRIAAKSLSPMVDRDEKDQAEKLRALMGQGVPGRVQALGSIAGDAETRWNVAEKLQKGWGVLTGMSPRLQTAAFEGWQIRKDRPKDFGTEQQVRAAFQPYVGQAMGGPTGDLMAQAWNIYAADMAATGDSGFNGERFRTVVRLATGGRQRSNGVIEGGIGQVRGRPVLLPDFLTAAEFDTALSRMRFDAAVNADGTPARKADILANMTPRHVGDNERGDPVYQWFDARGRALRAQGGRTVFEASFARQP